MSLSGGAQAAALRVAVASLGGIQGLVSALEEGPQAQASAPLSGALGGAAARPSPGQRQRRARRNSLSRHPSLKGDRTTQAVHFLLQVLIAVTQVRLAAICTLLCLELLPRLLPTTHPPFTPALRSGTKLQLSRRGCSQPLQPCGKQDCCWCRCCCLNRTGGTGDCLNLRAALLLPPMP